MADQDDQALWIATVDGLLRVNATLESIVRHQANGIQSLTGTMMVGERPNRAATIELAESALGVCQVLDDEIAPARERFRAAFEQLKAEARRSSSPPTGKP